MKKNIKILQKKLEYLQKQNQQSINLQSSSIFSIIKYKYRLHKQKKIESEIIKINLLKQKIEDNFDNQIYNWIHNLKMNCRKYSRLEPKAIYKKDKLLYKLGYISKRPISPIEKHFRKTFSPIYNFFKLIISKIPFYKLNPKKQFTNIAIKSTKYCIKNYRKLKNVKLSAQKSVLDTSLIKKIMAIKKEAIKQLDEESISNQNIRKNNDTEFIKSIRINVAPILTPNQINYNTYSQKIHEDHII